MAERQRDVRNRSAPDEEAVAMNDTEILEVLQQDLGEGIRLLLAEHGARVQNYLRSRYANVLDDHQIEDALADAAMKLADTYDPDKGKPLGGWLLSLADRIAIDGLRREQRHHRQRVEMPDGESAGQTGSSSQAAMDAEFAAKVRHIMATELSELERKVMTADIDEGGAVNAKQLAERFGTDPRSIYTARLRARRKMAKGLENEVSC